MKKRKLQGSLRVRLQLHYLLIITVSLLSTLVLTNFFYGRAIDSQANEHTSSMLKEARTNVDITIDTVDSVIAYLASNEQVLDYLRLQSMNDPGRIDVETAVRTQMDIYYKNRPEINGIIIVNQHGLYVSNQMSRVARYPLTEDEWYLKTIDQQGQLSITSPLGRNISIWNNLGTDDVIMLSRAVVDPITKEWLGVVSIDMHVSALKNIINNVTLGKTGYMFIMDQEGTVVYAPPNDTVFRLRPQWFQSDSKTNVYRIQGEIYQLLYNKSEQTGWIIGGVFAYGEMLEPMIYVRLISILVLLGTLGVALLLSIHFSNLFTKPIHDLRLLMHKAANGDLDVRYGGNDVGEMAQLGGSFNAMIDNIQSLMELVYVEQQATREAELKTMQAQIKPHFLYNTLDTVRWMAVENNAGEISDLVGALTKLFRISLSRGEDEIRLEEELEHVKSYLYIQKIRYEDKLNFQVECDPCLYTYYVKKLILQPLVENAIYHGIKQKRSGGKVQVLVKQVDLYLEMSVMDDGAGMSDHRIHQLNAKLNNKDVATEVQGFGIFNVNDRIRLAYGETYGLRYEKNSTGGINAIIRHPLLPPNDAGDRYV